MTTWIDRRNWAVMLTVLALLAVSVPAGGQGSTPSPSLWTGGDGLAASTVEAYNPGTSGEGADATIAALGAADCANDASTCAVSIGYGGSIELSFGVPFTGHSDEHVDITIVECCRAGGNFNEQAADGYEVAIRLVDGSTHTLVEVPDGGTISLSLDGPPGLPRQVATEFTEITSVLIRGEGDFSPSGDDPNPGPDIDAVIVHRAAGPDITEGVYRGRLAGVELDVAVSEPLDDPNTRLVLIGEESRFGRCAYGIARQDLGAGNELFERWHGANCDSDTLIAVMAAANGTDVVTCVEALADPPHQDYLDNSYCAYLTYQGPIPDDPDPGPTAQPDPTAPPTSPPSSPPPSGDGHPAGAHEVRTGQSNSVDDHMGYAMILSMLILAGVSLDDESAFAQSGGSGPTIFAATTEAFPDALAVSSLSGLNRAATVLFNPADRFFNDQLIDRIAPRGTTLIGGDLAMPEGSFPPHPSGRYPRIGGANRFDTAARIAMDVAAQTATTPIAYVATGANYPDALAGGAVASLDRAPILLVERDRVPLETASALQAIEPQDIILLGGDAVISDDVGRELAGFATSLRATRVFGADRTQTAVALSQRRFDQGADVVMVANAEDFSTAEQAASLAWATQGPLLLVRPGDVPSWVTAEIQRLDPRTLYVLNDRDELSPAVVDQLESLVG